LRGPKDVLLKLVEASLHRLYIAAEGTTLRREERQKAEELSALLVEIERTIQGFARRSRILLVDAAAGKSYVGLLAAQLVFERLGRNGSVLTLEQDARRCELGRRAATLLAGRVPIEFRQADVSDPAAWPDQPSLVTALHACGPASDFIIERAVASKASALLLVPCCTGRAVSAAARAERRARAEGFPRHAPVRRRFIQAWVDAERTLRLEAAGYQTEVVEFVAPTVTPHNLLWRARRVGESTRMRAARETLDRWDIEGRPAPSRRLFKH
jgi:hypothetical protein